MGYQEKISNRVKPLISGNSAYQWGASLLSKGLKSLGITRVNAHELYFVAGFFLVFLVIGLLIYRDYGISWDEPTQQRLGYLNYTFILGKNQDLSHYKDRFYGPIFEVLLYVVEKYAHPASIRDAFFLRHLFTFLSFYVGCFFFYVLSRNFLKRTSTALLCTTAFILSPRIFEHGFYNTKDIPSLVAFIITVALLFLYVDRKKNLLLVIIAGLSAFAITIRLSGALLPAFTFAAILVDLFDRSMTMWKRVISVLLRSTLFCVLVVLLVILLWPILWSAPADNFFQAIKEMSHYGWPGTILFMGTRYHPATEMPALYSIVWILITTPLFYTFLFLLGIVSLFIDKTFSLNLFKEKEPLKRAILAGWFFIPLLLVIILKSVLYDSWRHLYFIYPAFVLLAFYGLESITARLNKKFGTKNFATIALFFSLGVTFLFIAQFMVRNHPYQQLYFNRLAGESLREIQPQFDMEYWGLSYRKGLEYIVHNDPETGIAYTSDTWPGRYAFVLPPEEEKRLTYVEDVADAEYFITNYRYVSSYPYQNEVYSVVVDGAKILSVFKLK